MILPSFDDLSNDSPLLGYNDVYVIRQNYGECFINKGYFPSCGSLSIERVRTLFAISLEFCFEILLKTAQTYPNSPA